MAQTLEHLTRREKTLDTIRGIVRTMKTLAAINALPYEKAAADIEAYHATIRHGFSLYAYHQGQGLKQLLTPQRAERRLLIALGSDHGFCGSYNEGLAQAVQEHEQKHQQASRAAGQSRISCVGIRLQHALQDLGIAVERCLMAPASTEGLSRLTGEIVTLIAESAPAASLAGLEVHLAHTRRQESGRREACIAPLLPLPPSLLQAPRRWPSRSLPCIRMAPEPLLAALLRNHIFATVFRALAEAMATENAARLAIMQQAEQSLDSRLDALRREISAVRQEEITSELMDLLAGHEPARRDRDRRSRPAQATL